MTRTAEQEWWGGYRLWSEGPNAPSLVAQLPSGVPGAARMIEQDLTTSAGDIILPDARLLPTGGPLYTVWAAHVGQGIRDAANPTGTNFVAQLAADDVANLYLLDNTTLAGTWVVVKTSSAQSSTALSTDVAEFTFEFGPGRNAGLNLRTLCNAEGYDGSKPARVQVFIGPQNGANAGAVGGTSWLGAPGLDTGTFPANSLCIITVLPDGYITGRGGRGGSGQSITGGSLGSAQYGPTAEDGEQGGDGLHVRCDTVLYNHGRIQGGGGGGAGGNAVGDVTGPGGGGGAGWIFSARGAAGTRPSGSGFGTGRNGTFGVLNTPGLGGFGTSAGSGGNGGAPGQNGQSSSGTGGVVGAAGFAIRVASGVTLTKAVAGTIEGFEGAL